MPTLHIEHPIIDFDLWKAAFGRFAEFRKQSGVLRHRIQRPVDDPKYVVIDLDFATTGEAERFPPLPGCHRPRSLNRPRISRSESPTPTAALMHPLVPRIASFSIRIAVP